MRMFYFTEHVTIRINFKKVLTARNNCVQELQYLEVIFRKCFNIDTCR